jgi:methylamine--corrinoid protein Co-methyltransferase
MSIDRERVLDVLDRAHEGPVYKERDFNMRVIPQAIGKAIKKFGLANTCDRENPISQDDELADRYYQAGMDAAVEIGLLCKDTNRTIRFTEEEIQSALEQAPEEFWLGEGDQRVCYKHRAPEDPILPVWTVPLSIAVTEDMFMPITEGLARIPEVDALEGPSLETIWGRPLRSGSPYELMAGRHQADLMREAMRRAGREGMPMDAVGSSTTHYGVLGGYGTPGGYRPQHDLVLILSIADFITSYESLFKLAHTSLCGGSYISASSWVMLGGYSGGPEGTAVACVAYGLLMVAANTHIVLHSINNQVAGPGTKMLLYETLVGMTNMAVTGVSNVVGTRSAGGRRTNHLSPLEHKFGGEVFKGAAGMTRAQANEIVKQIIPKYEDQLKDQPDGLSFQECYDVERLEPVPEWQRMYDEVKEEAAGLGFPFK